MSRAQRAKASRPAGSGHQRKATVRPAAYKVTVVKVELAETGGRKAGAAPGSPRSVRAIPL